MLRSLIIQAEFDRAERAHDCQAISRHRLVKGEHRLKVRNRFGRGWDHYCVPCERANIMEDQKKLQTLFDSIAECRVDR